MSTQNAHAGERPNKRQVVHVDITAWLGGVGGAMVALVGQVLVGTVYNGYEAHDLLQALIPSLHALGGAVVQAAATILALMLTLLSLSRKESEELEIGFFERIRRIALLSSIALASAILLLLFLSIPLQESKTLPVNWFQVVYYALVVVTAGIAGLVVAIVIMLYSAIVGMIRAVRPSPSETKSQDQSRQSVED